ncbi:hypothetical protein HII31_02762 [Pseudocercospora fuligena]|uniref:Uncharacterized protein n=1 Tax=Pseudocercospora fuligena TaxID=685502 RepID=A0A8H6VMM3_9PEZI|nr:hypothetical protein HII31_02762 [Pseudocercospora fuligena]
MAFRRRSRVPSAKRQAIDDQEAYNSITNSAAWSTVVFAKDEAAPMQVLGPFPPKEQDHQSSTTTEAKVLPPHTLLSGVSLNKKLAIAISVPILFFVLLAVVAVAIYCSRLHRPHRKDASRRGSEHQREDEPENTPETQDQRRPAALEENGTQPDIKAILEALKSPKARSVPGPTPFAQTQDDSQQYQQPTRPPASLSTQRDSSSDDEGTHFSDLEDPFIDRSADTPRKTSAMREREAADSENQSLVEDASHPPEPPPPLEELEDPFVDAGDDLTTSSSQDAAKPDQKARQHDALAEDPGLWLKPIRKTDSAHGEFRQEPSDQEVQDDPFIDHEQTALGSDGSRASMDVEGRQHDDSSKARELERLEDSHQDLEVSSRSHPGSESPSTVIDDAYTTPKSEEVKAANGNDTFPNEPSTINEQEAEDLNQQPEVELPRQDSVEEVNDDLISHIEAAETSQRDSPSERGHDQSDSNIDPLIQDLATSSQNYGEQRDTLLGNDLTNTARSRSFAGREDDGEDSRLRRTVSR